MKTKKKTETMNCPDFLKSHTSKLKQIEANIILRPQPAEIPYHESLITFEHYLAPLSLRNFV